MSPSTWGGREGGRVEKEKEESEKEERDEK